MDVDVPPCPACGSPDQEVLKATQASTTLRCLECHEVQTASPRRLRTRQVPLIVSSGAESIRASIDVVTTETVEVGMEFEDAEGRLIVTGLEGPGGVRATCLEGTDVQTILAKRFDRVTLRFSVNEGPTTRSMTLEVEPDDPVHIGQVWTIDGEDLVVKTLKSDQNRTVRRGSLAARHVRRAFCDVAGRRREGPTRRAAPAHRRKG